MHVLPPVNACWATTARGDIFVHEKLPSMEKDSSKEIESSFPLCFPINFLHVQLMYALRIKLYCIYYNTYSTHLLFYYRILLKSGRDTLEPCYKAVRYKTDSV